MELVPAMSKAPMLKNLIRGSGAPCGRDDVEGAGSLDLVAEQRALPALAGALYRR